jgi:hypothetical protein
VFDDPARVARGCVVFGLLDDVLELTEEIGRATGFGLGATPMMTRKQQGVLG